MNQDRVVASRTEIVLGAGVDPQAEADAEAKFSMAMREAPRVARVRLLPTDAEDEARMARALDILAEKDDLTVTNDNGVQLSGVTAMSVTLAVRELQSVHGFEGRAEALPATEKVTLQVELVVNEDRLGELTALLMTRGLELSQAEISDGTAILRAQGAGEAVVGLPTELFSIDPQGEYREIHGDFVSTMRQA